MDFRQRLQLAAERGRRARSEREEQAAAAALSEEECRRLHSSVRLELTEHIEKCLRQLADNFPGFRYSPVMDEHGWGGAVSRDDLMLDRGQRQNLFSRLQMIVSPYNTYHVLEISAKGMVKNKENFTRRHFKKLDEIDLDDFRQLIERWVLDYAEQYSGS